MLTLRVDTVPQEMHGKEGGGEALIHMPDTGVHMFTSSVLAGVWWKHINHAVKKHSMLHIIVFLNRFEPKPKMFQEKKITLWMQKNGDFSPPPPFPSSFLSHAVSQTTQNEPEQTFL